VYNSVVHLDAFCLSVVHLDCKAVITQFFTPMNYQEMLHPWAIARPLPNNIQSVIVGRFRRRVDAEEHLKFLRRRIPAVKFFIVFDCQTNLL